MIRFFRTIRQRLLAQNRFTKYLVYATGEIVLVVIGILIALQINNWNEERKRKENYQATIEQIYNGLELETQQLNFNIAGLYLQQRYADSLYNFSDSLRLEQIPGLLFYLESEPRAFTTSIGFHIQNMVVNPKDKNENLLARNLTNYLSLASSDVSTNDKPISAIMIKEGFPVPSVNFGYSLFMGMLNDTAYFKQKDWEKAKSLLQTPEIRSGLVQLAQQKEFLKNQLGQLHELSTNSMAQIHDLYPEVKLLYENIGIIGQGTSNQNWLDDTLLTLVDEKKAIWEAVVTLKGGGVKIRENKSWNVNWGGATFPKGQLEWFGPDIITEAGTFRLIVNLSEKNYEFIPVAQ
ncbi:DUF6090 family protein [Flagellimonas aequoris]|uniref:Uncharacterized protein n=1 Tax=Flagellimonas aequoris TaxID=2306997 RepID=A0A418N3L4_9FLAO|nr:DUF6090 family protein [Allomuricauda aequoris]RIV68393.1 hypothetical protein D2U88_14325 [Allomuricauda aequoris]TXK00086.1 hypothetical protein FQ019_14170 [Allomuricauda aequoris]